MSWVEKLFGFFGLQIEKIPSRVCNFCDSPLPLEPAKVVLNDNTEVEICEICEKILELSNKVASGTLDKDEDDGDQSL